MMCVESVPHGVQKNVHTLQVELWIRTRRCRTSLVRHHAVGLSLTRADIGLWILCPGVMGATAQRKEDE